MIVSENAIIFSSFSILLLAALLVAQQMFGFCWLYVPICHPTDKIAHFITNVAGIFFFTFVFLKIGLDLKISLLLAFFVMLAASLFKEVCVDCWISVGDMLANAAGMIFSCLVLYFWKG